MAFTLGELKKRLADCSVPDDTIIKLYDAEEGVNFQNRPQEIVEMVETRRIFNNAQLEGLYLGLLYED